MYIRARESMEIGKEGVGREETARCKRKSKYNDCNGKLMMIGCRSWYFFTRTLTLKKKKIEKDRQ